MDEDIGRSVFLYSGILEAVRRPNAEIILYSDSKYVVDSVNKGWVFGWERKRFEKRLNADLWIRFLEVYRRHRVRFVWVKGHADNPMNNRCDQLAVAAATAVQNKAKTDEN